VRHRTPGHAVSCCMFATNCCENATADGVENGVKYSFAIFFDWDVLPQFCQYRPEPVIRDSFQMDPDKWNYFSNCIKIRIYRY